MYIFKQEADDRVLGCTKLDDGCGSDRLGSALLGVARPSVRLPALLEEPPQARNTHKRLRTKKKQYSSYYYSLICAKRHVNACVPNGPSEYFSLMLLFSFLRNSFFVPFFVRLFVFSSARNIQSLVRVDAIHLVRKSSKFELSSRFFGRLKTFDFIFGSKKNIWACC